MAAHTYSLRRWVHIELCVNSHCMRPASTFHCHSLWSACINDTQPLVPSSPFALSHVLKWTNGFGSNKRHRQIIQTSLLQIRKSIDGRDSVLRREKLNRHRCHPQRQTLDDVMHIQMVCLPAYRQPFSQRDIQLYRYNWKWAAFRIQSVFPWIFEEKKLPKLCERRRHRYRYGPCGNGINETFIWKLVSEVQCKNYERQMSGGRILNFSSASRFISISSRRAQNRNWNSSNERWTTDASTQR